MTKPTKPSFGSPKERGRNEETVQERFHPPVKDCPPLKRGPVETPNNDDTFSK
jgi:hypothetical protein